MTSHLKMRLQNRSLIQVGQQHYSNCLPHKTWMQLWDQQSLNFQLNSYKMESL
jgi:hypothetical protein